jgi:pimeloyl-ACP methyl ester carboxylesterase
MPRRLVLGHLLLLLGLVGAACLPAVSQAQGEAPQLVSTACAFDLPAGQVAGTTVRCGEVLVPEDRGRTGGPRVALPVAVFRARATNPDPVPTIYLEGGPGGAALQQPVRSDLPTLVLSGHFDPVTPPSYGERAAATLSRSYVYTLPTVGHGATVTECGLMIMEAFLRAPAERPSTLCINAQPRVEWVLPDD